MWFLEYTVEKHLVFMECSELQTSISPGKLILKFSGEFFCLWCNHNIPCSLQLTSSCFQSHKFSLLYHTQQQRWICFCAYNEGQQGSRHTLPSILNLSRKWRWCVKFMPQWVCSRDDLDVWEKRKTTCSCQKLNISWKYTCSSYTNYGVLLLSHPAVQNITAVEMYTQRKGLIPTLSHNVAAPFRLIQ
jgi:hypothetical protein